MIDTVLGHCGQAMLGNPTARWLGRWALQAGSAGEIPEALAGYYQQWYFIFMWCARVYHEKEQIDPVAAKALALRALFVPSPP